MELPCCLPPWGYFDDGDGASPYGTLVGRIGNGAFFDVGTYYQGVASVSGTLNLYHGVINQYGNSGDVQATISTVPEPTDLALLLAGGTVFGLRAGLRNHRPD